MVIYKAVFLDRDGTIARDVPYCSRPEDFELLPTVAEGIRLLNENNFKVIVVTNQSGIARGYFSEETLGKIHQKMRDEVAKRGGIVDAIYYCPHHPDDQCECRKPNTGLLNQAAKEIGLDLCRSYFIGDKLLDVIAAREARCKAVLVPSSEPEMHFLHEGDTSEIQADFVCPDFYTAITWVIAQAREECH